MAPRSQGERGRQSWQLGDTSDRKLRTNSNNSQLRRKATAIAANAARYYQRMPMKPIQKQRFLVAVARKTLLQPPAQGEKINEKYRAVCNRQRTSKNYAGEAPEGDS